MIDIAAAIRIRRRYLKRYVRSIPYRRRNEVVTFTCNVCGNRNWNIRSHFRRETADCVYCLSNPRIRAQLALLSQILYDRVMPITEFTGSGRSIMAMSEFAIVEERLNRSEDFTNTWLHQEPFLDIMQPVTEPGKYDVVLSAEVLEHVMRPVETAFGNLASLLAPGGHLILSLPFANIESTIEHFPPLTSYEFSEVDGRYILRGTTDTGETHRAANLVFHGGRGAVLEMRLFARSDILRMLQDNGFTDIRFLDHDLPEWGVIWNAPDSFPLVARKAG